MYILLTNDCLVNITSLYLYKYSNKFSILYQNKHLNIFYLNQFKINTYKNKEFLISSKYC